MNDPIAPIFHYASRLELIRNLTEVQLLYQDNSVILLEDAGFSFDREFFSVVELPEKYKKIGTYNGVTLTPYVLKDRKLVRNKENLLSSIIKQDNFLSKLVYEFRNLEIQMQGLVESAFPKLKAGLNSNCTFRLFPTREEGLHFDYFSKGKPMGSNASKTRLKIFFNLDNADRVWRVGPTLPDFLRISRGVLPDCLPEDLNTLNFLIDRVGDVERCASVEVRIPPGGAVITNGATVAHEIVYGNRMTAIEIVGENTGFLDGFKGEHLEAIRWMKDAGFQNSRDFDGFLQSLEQEPSGLERAKQRLSG